MQSSWNTNENIESIQDGFFSLDYEWRFTYFNRKAVQVLGKEPEEFIGKVVWEVFSYIIGTELEDAYRKAMELRVVQHIEMKGLIKELWYNIFVYPTAEGISIYWQDISKQKLSDKEHIETENKYQMLFNSIDQGFYVIDVVFDDNDHPIDMYYVEANESATRIVGADFTHRYIKDIDPSYETYWFEIFGQVALTGKSVRMEQYAEPDKKWYSFYIFKIGDESSRRIGNIFLDITERKNTEEALHNSEEKLRMILENSRDGINMLDLSTGKYEYMNSAQVMMTGFSAEEINKISAEEAYELVHPDDREISIEQHKLVAVGLDTFHDVEYRWKVKSGEYRWFSDRRKLIRDVQGKPIAMVGISRDVTDRKKAEEALKDSVESLHKLDQNKNKFLATLSHELRNPMASIMMSLSLLDHVPHGGEQAKQSLEIMKRQASQLSHLVDDLLEVTRINRNKIVLKKERIELNELVNRVMEDFQSQFADKKVSLVAEVTPSLLFMEADPVRLTQVIGNLIHNAVKFTRSGDTAHVTVAKDEKKQEAIITIRDTGMGIQPEILPDLFQPFVQADRSLDRSRGGLGLGLSVVKGIVELHGGSVAVSSEGLGKGSEFTIRLPLPYEKDSKEEQNTTTVVAASRALRILMIDDNSDLAEIMCELLGILEYEAIAALSGPEGIEKAKEFHPDVILCDIGLPGMNGYEVARNISKDNELKDIILIAVSGYAQPDDLELSKDAGFIRHLAKPVAFETLKMVLAEVQPFNK